MSVHLCKCVSEVSVLCLCECVHASVSEVSVRMCLRCQSVISMSLQGFFHLCSHENVDFSSTGKPLYFNMLKSIELILDKNVLNLTEILV